VLSSLFTLMAIGYFGMWEDTMQTVSMIFVSTVLSVVIGIPTGILMSRSNALRGLISPILDVMQTMPSFVYLIPVVMLLGIGKVPGLIAVVVYALPPIIRLTDLGIRLVDRDVLEAADAFGSSSWQKLTKVQLPLALPTIMAGVNQTIMMALAMVVVASMIGVQGLGQPVLKAIANQYFTLGMFNGLAIVGIAVIFDRVSQAYGKRLQRYREIVHG
jgi:glycine betaine/proline transport system permease protein